MIRRFIVKCLIFIIFVFFIACCITYAINTARPKLFNLNGASIVFFGNSHIETSMNDSIITNSRNFARSAEVPEYIYSKLNNLKRYNNSLDTIILGLDNHQLYYEGNTWNLMSPSFYDCLSPNDLYIIFSQGSFNDIVHRFSHPFDPEKLVDFFFAFRNPDNEIRNSDRIGGFVYLKRDKLAKAIELEKEKKQEIRIDKDINPVSLYFIDKIYNYCKDNNITLIFLCPPQHPLSKLDRNHFYSFISNRYPDIPFLNFINAKMPDKYFGDLDHLNHWGASAFSQFLQDSILHRPIKSINYVDSIK